MKKIIIDKNQDLVDLRNLCLTELLDLSDVELEGSYYCDNNYLTSLRGAPLTVSRSFSCMYNNLTSLEGIPKTVGVHFFIDKSLKDKFPNKYIRSLCKIGGAIFYR